MAKRMSKTLAAELADRTLSVVNPQSRAMALRAALARHGFDLAGVTLPDPINESAELMAWLLEVFSGVNEAHTKKPTL